MSLPGRRQVPLSTVSQYTAVSQNPPSELYESYTAQQYHLHDSQIISSPVGSISGNVNTRQYDGRQAVAMGVAKGSIGGAYGPYSVRDDHIDDRKASHTK